jgi:hypothetical protein
MTPNSMSAVGPVFVAGASAAVVGIAAGAGEFIGYRIPDSRPAAVSSRPVRDGQTDSLGKQQIA